MTLSTQALGQKTFEDLRQVIGRTTRTLEEWVLEAEELAEKNGYHEAAYGVTFNNFTTRK